MRLSWATLALLAIAVTATVAPHRAMAQQIPNEMRVDINLKDADMVTATRMLTQKTGLQFVVKPTAEPFGKITLKLDSVTAEEAIRYICESAGAYFRRDENGVFVISRNPLEEPKNDVPVPAPKTVKVTKVLKVLKADPRSIYEQIMFASPFDSMRGFEELKKFQ